MADSAQHPIDLYYWPTPNGWKITIMLEECGLPYAIHPVNIGKGDQFKPEFLAISPNNKMPAIVDHQGPDGEPISVFESGAILQYLGRSRERAGEGEGQGGGECGAENTVHGIPLRRCMGASPIS